MLCKTVLSLKSPTGAFIAPLRCANANLSGQGPSILLAQDRSVTQKPHWDFCCFANVNLLCKQNSRQFSAFVCVHQPDGFKDLLTRDFCCRRLFVLPGPRCCRGHRRVSHTDGHAVFKVQRAKRQQKSRHKTDQPCLRFFWKVMLVGYVTAESQDVQPRRV